MEVSELWRLDHCKTNFLSVVSVSEIWTPIPILIPKQSSKLGFYEIIKYMYYVLLVLSILCFSEFSFISFTNDFRKCLITQFTLNSQYQSNWNSFCSLFQNCLRNAVYYWRTKCSLIASAAMLCNCELNGPLGLLLSRERLGSISSTSYDKLMYHL
jgi:hypothetical protein